MASAYRDIAEDVVRQAASENMLPAVRAPVVDIPELERQIQAVLEEQSLTDEYEVEVRGEIVAVVPRASAG